MRHPPTPPHTSRSLHRLLQQQIELGRITLPPDLDTDAADAGAGSKAPASPQPPSPEAVSRQVEWLLAAHRGAGKPAAVGAFVPSNAAATDSVPQQPEPAASEQQGGGGSKAEEAAAEAEAEARVREQLAGISRSLWATLSAGGASGRGTYASRSQADYAYRADAIQAMRERGELDATHHRRRDAHSAYMEASARDAALRRGGHAKPADQ